MIRKKSKHPQWALRHKQKGTELRLLSGKYYLYAVTSKWDPEKKRAKKITGKLLGRITEEEGFIDSDKYKLYKEAERNKKMEYNTKNMGSISIKEYGLSFYLNKHLGKYTNLLESKFKMLYKEILCLSMIRLSCQSPIKNVAYHYERSFISEVFSGLDLSDKKVSSLLRAIGRSRKESTDYMKSFVEPGDHILIDGTPIVSNSESMDINKYGYNSQGSYDPQINAVFIFSAKQSQPVFHRILPGNIRDVKAFKLTIEESGLSDAILIADKGFYSNNNVTMLEKEKLNYIIPLKRDSALIDYSKIELPRKNGFTGYFEFQKRFIWYYEIQQDSDDRRVILYFDGDLKLREEKDYLTRIETHSEEYTIEKYRERHNPFGTITMCTNVKGKTAQDIYEYYKSRNEIETMFDAMKNVLNADTSYMQDVEAFQGWMFINHVALQWYYSIYNLLVANKLISKYSVKDVIMHLSGIKKIKINNEWVLAEVTKKTQTLLKKLNVPIT